MEPLKDYFHSTHLIVLVPPYSQVNIKEAVTVNVTVKCGGKESDHFMLTYVPKTNANQSLGGKNIINQIDTIKSIENGSQQRGQSGGGAPQ